MCVLLMRTITHCVFKIGEWGLTPYPLEKCDYRPTALSIYFAIFDRMIRNYAITAVQLQRLLYG